MTATTVAAALLLAGAAGCGEATGASHPAAEATPSASAALSPARTAPASRAGSPAASPSPSPARKVTVPAADRPACAQLLSRLQQTTQAISASSELIANSTGKKQLSQRIQAEARQLRQSAGLMGEPPVPAPLAGTDQQLARALQALSDDFTRAIGPAGNGDFQAAVSAMGDKPVVQKIVAATTTIQNACT